MPRVVADHGATLLVEFPDGTQQEVLRDSYQQAFPGSSYGAGTPGGGAGPVGPAPGAPTPQPAPSVLAPAPGMPNPTGAFRLGGDGAAFGMPKGLDLDTSLAQPTAPPPVPGAVPAHDPRRGQDIQLLPEYAQAERDYGAARIGAAQDLGDIESQELTQVAGALDQHHQAAEKIEADKLKAHQLGLKAAEKRAQEIDALADEYKNAKIDRGRLWKNMSTGNKVLAAIGLGLSAIGQAKSRQAGMNPAIQIMLGAIENDVADQRDSIGKLGKSVDVKKGLYHEFLDRLGNEGAAYDMALAQSAAQAKRQLEIIGAQSGSEKVKIQADDMAAQLGEYVAGKEELVRQTAGQEAYQGWQMRMAEIKQAAKGAGGGKSLKPDAGRTYKVFDAASGKLIDRQLSEKERDAAVIIPGTGEAFIAPTPRIAEDLNNRITAGRNISEALSTIERLRNENGWETDTKWYSSPEAQQAVSAYQRALINYKEAYGLGAISEADLKLVEGAIGGKPTGIKDFTKVVASTRAGVEADIRNRLTQYQWTPAVGDISLPAFATEKRADRTSVGDRRLKVEAAVESGDKQKIQEAARDLIGKIGQGGLADSYATGELQKDHAGGAAPSSSRELSKAEKAALGKKKGGEEPKTRGERYTDGSTREEARRTIEALSKVPKKDRTIVTIDGEVDPVEYLSKFLREGGGKDAKKESAEERRKRDEDAAWHRARVREDVK